MIMEYFDYLTTEERESIFYCPPGKFDRDADKETLAYGLGATLYMPATMESISRNIIARKHMGQKSMAICLEDAIGDKEIHRAEESVANHLKILSMAVENGEINNQDIPLVFIRVRNPNQIKTIAEKIGENLNLLTGIVFPKFSLENGEAYFEGLQQVNKGLHRPLFAMPILETPDIIFKESRESSLEGINKILTTYYDSVLNVRVGATDFSSLFGIRRSSTMTVYDMVVLRDCITDILNNFLRMDRNYVVSAPVWEYFSEGNRVFKPQLRQTLFQEHYGPQGLKIREQIIDHYLDGLIREVLLDKANGFVGKTIIHPSHIIPVQSLYVVSHEEYMDACSILNNNHGNIGVMKSQYGNKMNEIKPHLNWAKKIMIKSKIYGVFHEGQDFTSLLIKQLSL